MEHYLSNLPESPGVYIFKGDRGQVLYVGKANNLKNRTAAHFKSENLFGKDKLLATRVKRIEHTQVTGELEALLLESFWIKKYQPFFNSRAKDDKHPLYIKITIKEAYPRVFTTRREDDEKSLYFGPFPSTNTVRDVLKLLRSIFPFDTQKRLGKKACFWAHLGMCNPCPSVIEKLEGSYKAREQARYRRNIKLLVNVLSRKSDKVREFLQHEMLVKSGDLKFEDAGKIRDQIKKLDYVTHEYRSISLFLENPNLAEDITKSEVRELTKFLALHLKGVKLNQLTRIECFDASHTAMASPTVGMVTFTRGEADKNYYRRFRVKRHESQDDLAFLEEALRRRFSHPEWGKPDLLIIDGGKTQVGRAREVIRELKLKIPVVGIVKPFDDLVIPHQDGFLIKKVEGPAKSLIQRIRDEAHRFAITYHRKLRAKRVYLT